MAMAAQPMEKEFMSLEFPLVLPPQEKNNLALFDHAAFAEPSVWELIKSLIRPEKRIFDCLQVEITSQCAAKCTYCPHTTEASSWQGQHMLTSTFANLWPLLQQSTRVHLQGWGEPLLHPHFFDFVAFARKAGCLISTTSCGLHLNEKIALRILESGIDIMAFSLAGTDAASNDARQGADFHKVCEKIRLLQTLRQKHMAVHVELHLAYILLADRMEAVLHLPQLMLELGIHTAIISTLDYVPQPHLQALALRPEQSHLIARAKEILEQTKAQAQEFGVNIHYALPSMETRTFCRENIQKSLYINGAGDISPCVYLNIPTIEKTTAQHKTACFGNIHQEKALDIWQKESFVHFRQSHANNTPTHPLCQTCIKRHEHLG